MVVNVTNTMLNEMLDGLDEREAELILAVDDAYDALYSYKLNKAYGVEVVCNPGGDRTKVMIDGVVMDYEQFHRWLEKYAAIKEAEEEADEYDDYDEHDEYSDEESDLIPLNEVPEVVEITLTNPKLRRWLSEGHDLKSAVRNYLKSMTGYCLAKNQAPHIELISNNTVEVTNIAWGRKLSKSELEKLA